MSSEEQRKSLEPAMPYVGIADDGRPFLIGSRCASCGETYLGTRSTCARCYARDTLVPVELSGSGRLYNYTVVHRSYPGITVPFISAIIDLDEGCSLKGNLVDIDPASPDLAFDMSVDVVFREATIANPAAEGFVSHFFIPAKGQHAA